MIVYCDLEHGAIHLPTMTPVTVPVLLSNDGSWAFLKVTSEKVKILGRSEG